MVTLEQTPLKVLINLLQKWQINNIVSIDDDWIIAENKSKKDQLPINDIADEIFYLVNNHILDITADCERRLEEFEQYALVESLFTTTEKGEFEEILNKLTSSDTQKLCEILEQYKQSAEEFSSSDTSLMRLANVLGELRLNKFNVVAINEYQKQLHDSLEGKTLWLLDRDIKGDRTHIFHVLEIIVERKDIALIVTNDDSNLSSREKIGEFVSENFGEYKTLATSFLWVLKKDEVDINLTASVKNVLQGFTIHSMTESYNKIYQHSVEEAEKSLKLIDPDDYDNYFDVSYSEGSHVNDTVFRIRDSLILKHQHELLNNEAHYIDQLLINRELLESLKRDDYTHDHIGDSKGEVASTRQFSSLDQNSKIIQIHSFEQWDFNVNILGYPIYTGDLFSQSEYHPKVDRWVNTNTMFLLTTQPCDSIIRMTDKQLGRGTKNATLIKGEFFEYGTGKYIREVETDTPNKVKVHFLRHNNKYGMIVFDIKNILQIDFKVLDLCSIDRDGVAKLDESNIARAELMPAISREYYTNKLMEFIKEFNNGENNQINRLFRRFVKNGNFSDEQESVYSIKQIEVDSFKEEIMRLVQDISIKNALVLPSEVSFISKKGFTLKRIARLNDEYALDLIKKSTDYLGRQALPTYMLN